MNILSNIAALPTLTFKELQQRARNSHPNTYISPSSKQTKQNHTAILVVSPFYQKHKHNQVRCDCEFHRLRRAHQQHIKHPNNTYKEGSGHLHKLDLSQQIQRCEMARAGTKHTFILSRGSSCPKLLQPLAQSKHQNMSQLPYQKYIKARNSHTQQAQTYFHNNQSQLELTRNSLQRKSVLPPRAHAANWRRQKSIDTTNLEYIALISRRLQNEKYKKGYLETLFSFIKMKSNTNKLYMYHSKVYLANSLNLLLNHYTMQQLATPQQLDQHAVQKIAFYMACHHKQVLPILTQLTQAVTEMESFLNELKQKQAKQLQLQLPRQQSASSHHPLATSRKASSLQRLEEAITRTEINKQNECSLSRRQSKINLLTEQSDNQHHKRSTKGSTISLRKSILRSTLQFANNPHKTTDSHQQRQKQDKPRREVSQNETAHSNAQLMASTLPLSIGRSLRSTVFAVINECRGESRHSTLLKKGKQCRQHKNKPAKLPTYVDPYEKYNSINYSVFCSKRQFIQLVDQLQRLDQNDQQRAQKAFQMLKAEQFIDDGDKLNLMVSTFSPLFSHDCKQRLLKHIVVMKDRRYIEKLSKQLDFLLDQVKRTDPRNLSNQDLCKYKEDPILKNEFTQRIIPLRQSRDQHVPMLRKVAYQQQPTKASSNGSSEGETHLQLGQTELSSIRAQSIQSMLYQSIYYKSDKPSRQERVFVQEQTYTSEQQKQILLYMRQKHPNTFNYLSNQISALCSKLEPNQH